MNKRHLLLFFNAPWSFSVLLLSCLSLFCLEYWSQSINQSINQWFNQSINQSISQSVSQSVSQSINQSINQPTSNWWIDWSFCQTVDQSVSKSVHPSTHLSICQSVCQLISQLVRPHLPTHTFLQIKFLFDPCSGVKVSIYNELVVQTFHEKICWYFWFSVASNACYVHYVV